MQFKCHIILFISFWFFLILSGIHPRDTFTWWLETFPAILVVSSLAITYKYFRFSNMVYIFIWVHMMILLIGGHYTYAEVPLFNWLRETWSLERNYYDRLGHFAQGFVPALITREVLQQIVKVQQKGWGFFLVLSVCLGFSAFYEILEFIVAMCSGSSAEAFLGTQGDIWDTQWDMLCAFIGAIVALLLIPYDFKQNNKDR